MNPSCVKVCETIVSLGKRIIIKKGMNLNINDMLLLA